GRADGGRDPRVGADRHPLRLLPRLLRLGPDRRRREVTTGSRAAAAPAAKRATGATPARDYFSAAAPAAAICASCCEVTPETPMAPMILPSGGGPWASAGSAARTVRDSKSRTAVIALMAPPWWLRGRVR